VISGSGSRAYTVTPRGAERIRLTLLPIPAYTPHLGSRGGSLARR
jgi:hypothetical protein